MGTTFVRVRDRCFWMSDSVLETWLRLLALHVEDSVDSGSMATQIRDQWLLASRGFFTGCVPDGLNEAVATPEGASIVKAAIHSLLAALSTGPSHLGKDVFNLMGMEGTFMGDIESWRFVEVGNAFLALVEGKTGYDSSECLFMPGSGEHRVNPLG